MGQAEKINQILAYLGGRQAEEAPGDLVIAKDDSLQTLDDLVGAVDATEVDRETFLGPEDPLPAERATAETEPPPEPDEDLVSPEADILAPDEEEIVDDRIEPEITPTQEDIEGHGR